MNPVPTSPLADDIATAIGAGWFLLVIRNVLYPRFPTDRSAVSMAFESKFDILVTDSPRQTSLIDEFRVHDSDRNSKLNMNKNNNQSEYLSKGMLFLLIFAKCYDYKSK